MTALDTYTIGPGHDDYDAMMMLREQAKNAIAIEVAAADRKAALLAGLAEFYAVLRSDPNDPDAEFEHTLNKWVAGYEALIFAFGAHGGEFISDDVYAVAIAVMGDPLASDEYAINKRISVLYSTMSKRGVIEAHGAKMMSTKGGNHVHVWRGGNGYSVTPSAYWEGRTDRLIKERKIKRETLERNAVKAAKLEAARG